MGMRDRPLRQKEYNVGVEDGPDAILDSFSVALMPRPISVYTFSSPDVIPAECFYSVLAKEILEFKSVINSKISGGCTQIVIGGDHSVTFPSVLAALERCADTRDIGYIQFDSHGDLNQSRESLSGNFHGMYVRPLIDAFDIPAIESLVPRKLHPDQLLYVGNLDLDPKEEAFFLMHKMQNITGTVVEENIAVARKQLQTHASRFRHIHVTFDIDCLDKSEAPATGLPATNGMKFANVRTLLEVIQSLPSFSFDLVEVNPRKSGGRQTISLAQEILKTVVGLTDLHSLG